MRYCNCCEIRQIVTSRQIKLTSVPIVDVCGDGWMCIFGKYQGQYIIGLELGNILEFLFVCIIFHTRRSNRQTPQNKYIGL